MSTKASLSSEISGAQMEGVRILSTVSARQEVPLVPPRSWPAYRLLVETRIEELLSTEKDVVALHNALFSQDGLFHQLASGEEERRKLVESPLFRRAKALVNEMMLAAETELRNRLYQQS